MAQRKIYLLDLHAQSKPVSVKVKNILGYQMYLIKIL